MMRRNRWCGDDAKRCSDKYEYAAIDGYVHETTKYVIDTQCMLDGTHAMATLHMTMHVLRTITIATNADQCTPPHSYCYYLCRTACAETPSCQQPACAEFVRASSHTRRPTIYSRCYDTDCIIELIPPPRVCFTHRSGVHVYRLCG